MQENMKKLEEATKDYDKPIDTRNYFTATLLKLCK